LWLASEDLGMTSSPRPIGVVTDGGDPTLAATFRAAAVELVEPMNPIGQVKPPGEVLEPARAMATHFGDVT
jgi:hypothetical protein